MSEGPAFRRGDVILVAAPFVSDRARGKVRPAVVVQNDVGNRFSPNLIVAAISSQLPSRAYPTDVIIRHGSPEATGTGLDRDSVVQAEVILTIPKAAAVRRIGRFEPAVMRSVDRCLKVSLGLT
jgi:mRNA interferase MazF